MSFVICFYCVFSLKNTLKNTRKYKEPRPSRNDVSREKMLGELASDPQYMPDFFDEVFNYFPTIIYAP